LPDTLLLLPLELSLCFPLKYLMEESPTIQNLVLDLYSYLALRFPICCSSDEFVFFPQATTDRLDWSVWDDLSPSSIEDAVSRLKLFRVRLCETSSTGSTANAGVRALLSLSAWVAQTLEEQLVLVKTHTTQPTFHLTLATVGLIQAMQSRDGDAVTQRLRTLPVFLDAAFGSLSDVPELYRDLGVQMTRDLSRWLRSLESRVVTGPAEEALAIHGKRLAGLSTKKEFRLDRDLLEQIVTVHTGSGLTVKEALAELDEEASSVRQLLVEEAGALGYQGDWEKGYQVIEGDPLPLEGKEELLRLEIDRLRDHCRRLGFLDNNPSITDKIAVEALPESLASVRAADSYNAIPGHPFQGGIFYIFSGGSLGAPSGSIHPVYRMTAAHETYPGHHLLDLFRWSNPDAALRPVEYPLFYEGWACYGEDLMFDTHFFERPYDRLILLRRRFRHAVRGKVDLWLHSGEMDYHGAARELVAAGFPPGRAVDTVRKYALRPAYQMCYTIGRRRFQRLSDSFGQSDFPQFVNTVLSGGELLFEDLEEVLKETTGHGDAQTRRREEEPI